MTVTESDLDAYCREHRTRFVEELSAACRIPSISADPAYTLDVMRSAEHLAAAALEAGFTHAELLPTGGHPAVYAEYIVDPALPTALIYGHHDVQPVDPLDEWVSPPFEPQVRDNALYARGAVDDKGQVWMHLKAVEAHLRVRGTLPLNLKLIVEGEEEIGSVHFDALVARERDRLAADVAVVSDTPIFARGVPSLCTGLRGLANVEVEVSGPSLDLHSGNFGGAVANPLEVLARILASLKDPVTGRITVPGFYDRVREPSDEERAQFAALPFDEGAFLAEAGGAPGTTGEEGWTTLERLWVRPTLELNGIWGGYQGPGSKTIVPARAHAKITCRLVPDQEPAEIAELVAAAVRAAAGGGPGELRGGGAAGAHPERPSRPRCRPRRDAPRLRRRTGADPDRRLDPPGGHLPGHAGDPRGADRRRAARRPDPRPQRALRPRPVRRRGAGDRPALGGAARGAPAGNARKRPGSGRNRRVTSR
ncbi:MAG TPA: dipeptidase [Candidatus Dormibacteraeota bacterium]|nr:dipeptidase [Candidatus Dormibacteraeota bacterium]